jgi:hypothetical protein
MCQKCPFGWIYRNKSCYLLIRSPTANYLVSAYNCSTKGGYLLNLTDENEFNDIKSFYNEYFTVPSQIWVS